jgi:hypothetical protein
VYHFSRLSPSPVPMCTTCPAYLLFLSPMCSTCPAYLLLLDLITRRIFAEEHMSQSSSLCSLLHSLPTSSLLGPNIFLSTVFLNILNIRNQTSQPYKTTDKITVLYILIFVFFDWQIGRQKIHH